MADTNGFPCKLCLPCRSICGTATFVDSGGRHNHVLRLHIRRSLLDMAISWAASWVPAFVRNRIQALIPGPFLPPTLIIKKLKPTWDPEFDDEKQIYQKLSPLQGHAIPVFYGEGTCDDGVRALLLSDVGDASLHAPQAKHLGKPALKRTIKPAVRAMLELGVEPADHNPRNYHLVRGDVVVVLDLEDTADFDPHEQDIDELAEAVADGVAHWTVFYHQNHNS